MAMPWWGWLIVIGIIILIIVVVLIILIKKGYGPRIKQWLLYQVLLAEKELGSGTGQLKLRTVYDHFMSRFPIISLFISFTTFSNLVDNALSLMDTLLADNPKLNDYIKNLTEETKQT